MSPVPGISHLTKRKSTSIKQLVRVKSRVVSFQFPFKEKIMVEESVQKLLGQAFPWPRLGALNAVPLSKEQERPSDSIVWELLPLSRIGDFWKIYLHQEWVANSAKRSKYLQVTGQTTFIFDSEAAGLAVDAEQSIKSPIACSFLVIAAIDWGYQPRSGHWGEDPWQGSQWSRDDLGQYFTFHALGMGVAAYQSSATDDRGWIYNVSRVLKRYNPRKVSGKGPHLFADSIR